MDPDLPDFDIEKYDNNQDDDDRWSFNGLREI